jgi:uncharacterized protein with HEPN domain
LSRTFRDLLADMLVHAQDAIACVEGMDLPQVQLDRLRRLALERCFEIIGEAAGKIDPSIRERFPTVPWAEMIAVRNRLAHAYFAVDMAILYHTACDLLPSLLPALQAALDEVTREETSG